MYCDEYYHFGEYLLLITSVTVPHLKKVCSSVDLLLIVRKRRRKMQLGMRSSKFYKIFDYHTDRNTLM